MKVRVKEVRPGFFGFYGNKRRLPGDVFTIESKKELGSWMEVIEEPKAEKPKIEPKVEKPKFKKPKAEKPKTKEEGAE